MCNEITIGGEPGIGDSWVIEVYCDQQTVAYFEGDKTTATCKAIEWCKQKYPDTPLSKKIQADYNKYCNK